MMVDREGSDERAEWSSVEDKKKGPEN